MSFRELASSAPAPVTSQRAVLAIDYGRRRMGLALSDRLGLTARPLATWERTNRRRDLARLRELCRQHAVGGIVVGWPLRLDGTPGEMAREAAGFAGRLRKHIGLPVELVDERLSSWEATEQTHAAGNRSAKPVDELAAAVILRDYLTRARAARPEKAAKER
jgi:putative Holliday junction resolvase